jgi:Cleaved Adhesin Domain/Secretion system C-terminal sorting domain
MKKIFTSLAFLASFVATMSAQAPANDNCSGAIAVMVAADSASSVATAATTLNATQSTEANACSASWYDDDVWYTFVAPAGTDSVIVRLLSVTGSPVTNFGMAVYSGGCGGTGVDCFSGARNSSRFPASALTAGQTYHVRIWGAGTGAATTGAFELRIFRRPLPTTPLAGLSVNEMRIFSATPTTRTIALTNGGGATLNVGTPTGTGGGITLSNLPATVAAGSSALITVNYAPGMGDSTRTITIPSTNNGGNVTFTVKGYSVGMGVIHETFDAGVPASFQNLDADGDGNLWGAYTIQAHTSGNCIRSASWATNPLTPDNYLVLPRMTPRAGNNKFTFFAAGQDASFSAENYEVYVSTAAAPTAADFTTSLFTEVLADTIWRMKTVDLSAYNGQNVFVAVRHHNVSDQFILKLDDFRFPDFLVSTEEAKLAEGAVKAFPNPTTGAFQLTWASNLTDVSIQVSDLQGKLLQSIKPTAAQHQFDLSNMPAGLYSVRLKSAEGAQTIRVNVAR